MTIYFPRNSMLAVYDAEADAAAAAAKVTADAAAAKAKADADAAIAAANKTFTQEELNNILSKERRAYEDKTKQTITQLEELKKGKSLSDDDKNKLTKRIESLNDELLTKEQLATKERDKLRKSHEEEKTKIVTERDTWQQRYRTAEISRAISDAATKEDAFDSAQIAALLVPNASLVEELDNEGTVTGNYVPKVKFKDVDKDGKPVTLDLTIPEAVKRMKETPEKFGNLFKSTANGGLGMNPGVANKTQGDLKNMNPAQWREYRKKSGLANAGK